jgi:hypothetical protein
VADEIAAGMWRWTAPHPDWRPEGEPGAADDWEQDVGCVLAVGADHALFIDPLLPAGHDAFWAWCDAAVGERSVHVLTTIRFHSRSREAVADRYGGEVVASLRSLPPGVQAFPFRAADETMFWLSEHRALVPGDRIIGAEGNEGGGVRLCPDSWMSYLTPAVRQAELRALLSPLLELPAQRILVSHGDPLLSGGADALRRILA